MPPTTPEQYIESHLSAGSVFKISAPELIGTDIPHYFIVVAYDDDEVHFVECTTNRERLEGLFERNGFNLNGLVYIPSERVNGLTRDTYVNCNDNYTSSIESLLEKCESNNLQWVGDISYDHYDQIRTGIIDSHINDLPDDYLNHPED